MATKKRSAKKAARKTARKNRAEEGIATAKDVFAKFLRKADPKGK